MAFNNKTKLVWSTHVTQYFFFIQAFELVDNSIWQKNYSKLLKYEYFLLSHFESYFTNLMVSNVLFIVVKYMMYWIRIWPRRVFPSLFMNHIYEQWFMVYYTTTLTKFNPFYRCNILWYFSFRRLFIKIATLTF